MDAQLGLLDHRLAAVELRQAGHEEREKVRENVVTELRIEQAAIRSLIRTAAGILVVLVPVLTAVVVALVNKALR